MNNGFIKCAAASFEVKVADTASNCEKIKEIIALADKEKANIVVFPELSVTGYTCGDLFFSDTLLAAALDSLASIAEFTADKYPVAVVGLPVKFNHRLFNCAAVCFGGEVLGIVPKTAIPNYGEFYEKRYFAPAADLGEGYNCINVGNDVVPIDPKLIFCNANKDSFRLGIEICEDLWGADTPSRLLCKSGATVIANPSASSEAVGKAEYRNLLLKSTSARLVCGYIYSSSLGESTSDAVYGGHLLLAENGKIIKENLPFGNDTIIYSEIDVDCISTERKINTEYDCRREDGYTDILFNQPIIKTELTRKINKNPFIPENVDNVMRAEQIIKMQCMALKKRIEHTSAKALVLGISGGLDSCLALLVSAFTADLLNRPRTDVIAVTMPCFGTTIRTKGNAEKLCEALGVTLREIDIKNAVNGHFADIGHDPDKRDVTYENSQARERTQILMDIANIENGLVIGTGDLSELALGWATYNGDHMSMYGVNAGIPKTLIQHIVRTVAQKSDDNLKAILLDIVDTPVSPELLPADNSGNIAQKTEDLVGPYELHDFFLYYMLRYGFAPKKLYYLATIAFKGDYDNETILKWLKVFTRRFFTQQFKRSCMPDGVKVGSVSLSPRGGFRMPSDALYKIWLDELEGL